MESSSKAWNHENELSRGEAGTPKPSKGDSPAYQVGLKLQAPADPISANIPPAGLMPFYPHPRSEPCCPGHGALQRKARKLPAHSMLDALCQTPTSDHRAVAKSSAELEGWGLAGPHPRGPGGFGPACQHRAVAMVAQSPARCVTSPPAAWPRHQITGPCHSRGEDWSPCMQPWQTTGLL